MMTRTRMGRWGRPLRPLLKASPSNRRVREHWVGELVVQHIVEETKSVRTFRLGTSGAALPFRFRAGQYIDISAIVGGQKLNRSYSISSSSEERGLIDLTIKRETGGRMTGYLFDGVRAGSAIDVRGPFGQFTADPSQDHLVFIGAGVGVTPLVSMARSLTDQKSTSSVHCIFGYRSHKEALFLDELQRMASGNSRMSVDFVWSQPVGGETGQRGRIDARLVRRLVNNPKSASYFICGPDQMMTDVRQGLAKLGIKERRIRTEAFSSPVSDQSLGGEFPVNFSVSGVTAHSAAGQSILDVAEKAGVDIDHSCRTGTCGLCIAKLEAGEVEMLSDDILEDEDTAEGLILTCQAYPRKTCQLKA
ncbi:MAG: iron-sulfur cluster-binding domain-containing protein [Parvularculaceae bacterium]|nr:iron-sulfur cluster-binding domain-containing protein [Parvularculaceae bacterium]